MAEKICPKCKIIKPVDQFYVNRNRGKPQAYCKLCNKLDKQIHYSKNKETYRANAKKVRVVIQAYINDLKSKSPCADCGKIYPPYVMDFDHVKGIKHKAVAHMVANGSYNQILKEIEKCDIVCSNCHRERTHQRKISAREGANEPN